MDTFEYIICGIIIVLGYFPFAWAYQMMMKRAEKECEEIRKECEHKK
jgi:hypothetical protein